MELTGSEILVQCLREQGVDTVFGYPGGCILNVYDALYKHSDEITHILTSHEQGASHAADGYARATGKVGVCMATSGPGATNLVTGIATAYMDSIPIIAITCNVAVSLLGRDSFQEIDIAGVTMPIDVGIMPILDQAATINMALSRNGCVMDRELSRLISKYWIFPNPFDKAPFDDALEQKKEDFKKAGIEYTIKQIDKYRALGVEGIHLYALNKWKDVSEIIKESGMRTLV